MEESSLPGQERIPEEAEGGTENPVENRPGGSSEQPSRTTEEASPTELVIDVGSAEDSVRKVSPRVERAIDSAARTQRMLRSSDARMAGTIEALLGRRSPIEQQMLDKIRQLEAFRPTIERQLSSAAEFARNTYLEGHRSLAEDVLKNRSFIESQMADEAHRRRSLWDYIGSVAEESRRIRSMWDHRILEASEPLRSLRSSVEEMTLKAGGLFPAKPLLDNDQIRKLANLSIGVGRSLSSVLPQAHQSTLLKSVGELERFRDLQSALHPSLASFGALNVESVARFSPASLGFSTSLFSEIQRSTANLGATVSMAVAEMERVAGVWEEWDRQMDLHADRLGERGWTYPMSLSLPQLSEIIQCEDAEKLDSEFVEFYNNNDSENFGELCGEIMASDHLTPWHAILGECVECHRDQRFLVSATCLISVLEGAITKRHGGRLKQRQLTEFFEERIREAGEDRMEAAMWKSIAAFVKQLFAQSDFSGDAPARINRHWILHGKAVPTGKEADSLRLFQAIHTVSVIYDLLNRIGDEEVN